MAERESLLQGLNIPGAKADKSKDAHARGELLALGAPTSGKAAKSAKPTAAHDHTGHPESPSRAGDRLKLGIVTLCLAVAGVLLAQYFGFIELWGSVPPPPPPTQEEVEFVKDGVKQLQQDQQRIDALPPEKRPVQAGS